MRAKIASLLGNLAKTPGFNSSLLVDEIQNMVIEESKNRCLVFKSNLIVKIYCEQLLLSTLLTTCQLI